MNPKNKALLAVRADMSAKRETPINPSAIDLWKPIQAVSQGNDVISIFEIVESGLENRIAAALRRNQGRPVTVQINSPGGDYFAGTTVMNMLREHDAKVTVEVLGIAASAASVIAMAGEEIIMRKAAMMMIHRASGVAIGNGDDMRDIGAILDKIDGDMSKLYQERTGKSAAEIDALMTAETFFSADEAVAIGLADGSDDIEVEEVTATAEHALRKVDALLRYNSGLSRTEARSLLSGVKGVTQDADPDPATLDAGTSRAIEALINTLSA